MSGNSNLFERLLQYLMHYWFPQPYSLTTLIAKMMQNDVTSADDATAKLLAAFELSSAIQLQHFDSIDEADSTDMLSVESVLNDSSDRRIQLVRSITSTIPPNLLRG